MFKNYKYINCENFIYLDFQAVFLATRNLTNIIVMYTLLSVLTREQLKNRLTNNNVDLQNI